MKRHPFAMGVMLVLGLTGCGAVPMSVSQAGSSTLLLPPGSPGTRIGGGSGPLSGPGGATQPIGRVGITALRNNITSGILSYYPAGGPDNSYSVSNLTFAEPSGAWNQMAFRATVSLIGIAGPGYPVSRTDVTGFYDRASQRVISLYRTGNSGTAQPVTPPAGLPGSRPPLQPVASPAGRQVNQPALYPGNQQVNQPALVSSSPSGNQQGTTQGGTGSVDPRVI